MSASGVVYGGEGDGLWQRLRARLRPLEGEGAFVKVGLMGTADRGSFGVVHLGAVHEFGSPARRIPARSFIRRTFEVREPELRALTARLAARVVLGALEGDKALGLLGAWGASQVKSFIATKQVRPQLHESAAGRRTLARKRAKRVAQATVRNDTTLVDTGRMLNAITWQVVTAEGAQRPGAGG